eukprot:7096951-Pyramimonas_sp.AAC.1
MSMAPTCDRPGQKQLNIIILSLRDKGGLLKEPEEEDEVGDGMLANEQLSPLDVPSEQLTMQG